MNSVKFCCVVLEVLAGSCLQCLRGVSFWEGLAVFWRGAYNVLEGCLQCFGGVLAIFGGAWHFGGGACSCFGGVWHFWRACGVLEGCDILEEVLAEFWRALAVLQCFGGALHFGGGACSVLVDVAFL